MDKIKKTDILVWIVCFVLLLGMSGLLVYFTYDFARTVKEVIQDANKQESSVKTPVLPQRTPIEWPEEVDGKG